MNRRGFLGALARTPVIGALAGKAMADEATAKLAGISLTGIGGGSAAAPLPNHGPPNQREPTEHERTLALKIPALRTELESLFYEDHRQVYAIDTDLAVMRSFSLSAKVTYQRQRIVARRLADMQHGYLWQRLNTMIFRALGLSW